MNIWIISDFIVTFFNIICSLLQITTVKFWGKISILMHYTFKQHRKGNILRAVRYLYPVKFISLYARSGSYEIA
jgi:hypothetical protein